MTTLSVIQYPSKRFGFVGMVPSVLAYSGATKEELSDIKKFGPGLVMKCNPKIKSLSWDSKKEALDFASLNGIKI